MPRQCHVQSDLPNRRNEDAIIVLAVRWYISYRLSLRELVEMLAERRLDVYPSRIWR